MSSSTAPAVSGITISRRDLTLVFISLMLTMLLASLNNTLISSAMPTIVGELHGVEHMSWVVTAFILASTITMPIYGKVSDLIGRKHLLVSAILIFLAGSVLGALTPNIEVLILARVVQGLGGGGLMILSQAVIADVVPARERGQYMGILGAVFGFSSIVGPLVGGWLTDGPGWRWVLWVNVPIGILALIGTLLFLRLPTRHRATARIDVGGMALLAVATTAIVLVAIWGGTTYDWTSWQILGLGAVAIVAAVAFVGVERVAAEPVFPLEMFRDRNFVLTTIASLAMGVAMFGTLGYMPIYLQMVTGLGASIAGLLMIPMMGMMLVTGVLVGRLISSTGRYRWAPIAGMAVMAVGLVLLSLVHVDTPVWLVCVDLAVLGLGVGLGMQVLTLIVQNSFPNRMVGTATAANNYFRQVGATLGSAVVGALFAARLTERIAEHLPGAASAPGGGTGSLTPQGVWELPAPIREVIIASFNEALMPVFLWLVPLVAIGFVVAFFVREKPLATAIEHEIPSESLAVGQHQVLDPELDARPSPGPTVTDGAPGRGRGRGADPVTPRS